MFRLLHLLGPLSAPTLTLAAGRLGRIHHAMDERSPTRTVASLHVRIGQLTCQDSHPEDRGLIGRYITPGVLAPAGICYSGHPHLSTPCAPLTGTPRFRRHGLYEVSSLCVRLQRLGDQ